MGDYKTLFAYEKSFSLAMEIYVLTKSFPQEEKYSLIDQIRRSSRSVCTNIVEAYKRRRYKDYFISKLK
jgi:four helix bundle protein